MVLFIIFGTQGITYSKGSGQFHCPQCAGKRQYKIKRVRRFFTLYFIPLIPLDKVGEYVECSSCKGTFRHEVLDYDPEAQQQEFEAEFERAVKRVLALMMLADGDVHPDEIATMVNIATKVTGHPVSEAAVQQEISLAQHEAMEITEYLGNVAPFLNDEGKETIVRGAVLMAASDGEFQEEERMLLGQIGQGLQMSSAHLKGVVAETLEPTQGP